MQFRVIDKGAYGADSSGGSSGPAAVAVATDAASYANLWARFAGHGEPPNVDFAKDSVIFLSLGTRRSGGFSVEPQQVSQDGDIVVIAAKATTPAPGAIVTMAFTAPYAVVTVNRPGVKAARWVDLSGTVVAEAK